MSRRKAATEGPMPADFAEHAYGRIKDLRKRYNARYELIVAWRAELGLTGAMVRKKVLTGVGRREIPEGFAEYRTATSLRAMDREKRAEKEALVELYGTQLGLF